MTPISLEKVMATSSTVSLGDVGDGVGGSGDGFVVDGVVYGGDGVVELEL